MFRRFAAGSAIGAFAIAIGALVLVSFGLNLQGTRFLTMFWCFVPLAWGIWAMLTPKAWLPDRLPYWGAILGFIGGFTSAFILNLPSRTLDIAVSGAGRLLALVAVTVLYYFLWMLVRFAYESLAPTKPRSEEPAIGPQLKKAA
jgi:hypothetical protein